MVNKEKSKLERDNGGTMKIELGKEQKGLLEKRRGFKIDRENNIIKTDHTWLDISIYLAGIILILVSIYCWLTSNLVGILLTAILGTIVLICLVIINERITYMSKYKKVASTTK